MIQLPPAVVGPCNECPWRRDAEPGHLGPYPPEKWIEIAHSEEPVACHKTIPPGTSGLSAEEAWAQPEIRQCRGMAIFRCNVHKSPRNPTDAEHMAVADTERVFESDIQFVWHHSTDDDEDDDDY